MISREEVPFDSKLPSLIEAETLLVSGRHLHDAFEIVL